MFGTYFTNRVCESFLRIQFWRNSFRVAKTHLLVCHHVYCKGAFKRVGRLGTIIGSRRIIDSRVSARIEHGIFVMVHSKTILVRSNADADLSGQSFRRRSLSQYWNRHEILIRLEKT